MRRAHAAMNSFDAEALVALCEPDVTFESRITALETATYHGYDGVRDFIARLAASFEWIEVEAEEVLGDGDRFVVSNSFRARGASSGAEVEQHFVQGVRLRNGRAAAWAFYDTLESALADARAGD